MIGFVIRFVLMALWFVLASLFALALCVIRGRDVSVNRDYAHALGLGMLRIAGIRLKVTGYEHLHAHQPCIYVGNHQGAMDIGTFGRIYPRNTVVIGKRELLYIPFFGLIFWAAGNILIHRQRKRKAIHSLDVAVEAVRDRRVSIWIFPEGTRNRTSAPMLPFKKGAFHMAVQAGIPILPLVSAPLQPLISWKDKRMNGGTLPIHILPPIFVDPHAKEPVEDLSARTRAVMEAELKLLSAGQTP